MTMIVTELNPIQWKEGKLYLLDQRHLPYREDWVVVESLEQCFDSIQKMVVRGAPCIGYTAIYGLGLWAQNHPQANLEDFRQACGYLKEARPTAVNLEFEINRSLRIGEDLERQGVFSQLSAKLLNFAREQINLSEIHNRIMAQLAETELESLYGGRPLRILTHCNTGFLACGSLGTALGVITHLNGQKKIQHVWVDETRPFMQGTRLTSFELSKLGIPYSIVIEGAASYLMREKLVDAIFVGADRIVANGDTANKIGTSNLAIVANHYKIPFYVVAPVSSFDLTTRTGEDIKIELRNPEEILEIQGVRMAPQGAGSLNPSFDVTEGKLIAGIFCEKGLIRPNDPHSLEGIIRG